MDHLTYVFVLPQFFKQFFSAAEEFTSKIRNKSQAKSKQQVYNSFDLLVVVSEL